MDGRGAIVSGVVVIVLAIAPCVGSARASDEPPIVGLHDREVRIQACRNHLAANRHDMAAPEVVVLARRTSPGPAGSSGDRDDTCRQRSGNRRDAVAPRVIVSGAGLEVDGSVAENWWSDLWEPPASTTAA